MPYASVHDRRLFYSDHSPHSSRSTLLLLHGAAANRLIWPRELCRLPETRVLALDLPGHGRSEPPGRRLIRHYASVVANLLVTLRLTDVVVLGHSMGGAIALQLAAEAPALVRGLVIAGASARMRVSDALLGASLADREQAIDFLLAYGFVKATADTIRRCRDQMLDISPTTFYGDFLACACFDVRHRLDDIRAPALVIAGTEDRLTPIRFSAALASDLRDARLACLEGSGHYMMLERPAEVGSLVSNFISELG